MVFKEQAWFEMRRNGVKFELIVRDQDWKKLETKKFTPQNFKHTIKDIGKRYGIDKKMLTPSQEVEDEIGWLKKENILS